MNAREAESYVAKGMTALDNDHIHLALVCFRKAAETDDSSTVCSGLGYCLAAVGGEVEKGVALCREALASDPDNIILYRNLGNALLVAGNRSEAIAVFRDGLRIGKDDGITRKLESLGTRKPLVFKSLSRKHVLNKAFGLVLDRLGLR